jgi:hypothetical protein
VCDARSSAAFAAALADAEVAVDEVAVEPVVESEAAPVDVLLSSELTYAEMDVPLLPTALKLMGNRAVVRGVPRNIGC